MPTVVSGFTFGRHRSVQDNALATGVGTFLGSTAHHPAACADTLSSECQPCQPSVNSPVSNPPTRTCRTQMPRATPRRATAPGRFLCFVPTRVLASRWHSADRVQRHAREVDRPEPQPVDRKRLRRDVDVEAAHPPNLNRPAAAALLRIVLRAANHDDASNNGGTRSVQS